MRKTALTALTAAATTAALLATITPAAAAHGALVVTGLTASDSLVTFRASAPGTLLSSTPVTGVVGDLQAIDFRPATGALYGVGVLEGAATVYTIDPSTGVATAVFGPFAVSDRVSIDVNPAADALRIVDSAGSNLRLRFSDLTLFTDGRLAYVAGDANAGAEPAVGGVAYINNDNSAATPTTLFDVDAALDQLVLQNPPNAGGLQTIGALPAATKAQSTGFDVYTRTTDGVNWAFVSLFDKGRTTFFEIDLTTGQQITRTPAVPGSGKQIATTPHVTDIALAPAQAGF